jgi:hypothetical protein
VTDRKAVRTGVREEALIGVVSAILKEVRKRARTGRNAELRLRGNAAIANVPSRRIVVATANRGSARPAAAQVVAADGVASIRNPTTSRSSSNGPFGSRARRAMTPTKLLLPIKPLNNIEENQFRSRFLLRCAERLLRCAHVSHAGGHHGGETMLF